MKKKLSNLQNYIVISAKHKSIEEFYFSNIYKDNDLGDEEMYEKMYKELLPEMVDILMKRSEYSVLINILLENKDSETIFYELEKKIKNLFFNTIELNIKIEIENEIYEIFKLSYDEENIRYSINGNTELTRKYKEKTAAYSREQFKEIILEYLDNQNHNNSLL